MTDEDRLRALVAAVADGTPVDWQRAESGAQTDEERALVRQLRLIATLSEVSRTDEGTHTAEAGEPRAGLLTTTPMPDQTLASASSTRQATQLPQRQGTQLPRTASPLFLIALVGLASFGAAAALLVGDRLRRRPAPVSIS